MVGELWYLTPLSRHSLDPAARQAFHERSVTYLMIPYHLVIGHKVLPAQDCHTYWQKLAEKIPGSILHTQGGPDKRLSP